jgi:hypothetical protein
MSFLTCFESISAIGAGDKCMSPKSINFVLTFAARALPGKYNLLEKIAYLPP